MKTAALIPARSGSDGLKDKNVQKVGGFTLIEIAIKHARMLTNDVHVSSDSDLYLEHAAERGVNPIKRPDEISDSMAPIIDVVRHARRYIHADYIAIFQPTHPFRMMRGILDEMPAFIESGNLSGCAYRRTDEHIYRRYRSRPGSVLQPVNRAWGPRPRRQDRTHDFFIDTGEFFIVRNSDFLKSAQDQVHGDERISPHVFPGCLVCDIHDFHDLEFANRIWKPVFINGIDS